MKKVISFKIVMILVLTFIFLTTSTVAISAIITSSNFESGPDGWTWLSADQGISWQSSGGNPDGYIRYDNNKPYETSSIYAPTQFLGNWDALGVTSLSYEAKIFQRVVFTK